MPRIIYRPVQIWRKIRHLLGSADPHAQGEVCALPSWDATLEQLKALHGPSIKTLRVKPVHTVLRAQSLSPTSYADEVPLFDRDDSVRLLDLCQRQGLGVLGIEGFTLSGNARYPDTNHVADFSTLLGRDDFEAVSLESARRFLRHREGRRNLYFEYVLAKLAR
jgi:hypothetical protein